MSIQELYTKFKGTDRVAEYLLVLLIICVSLASFLLGRASVKESSLIMKGGQTSEAALVQTARESTVKELNSERVSAPQPSSASAAPAPDGGYVASKSGTKYHLPWCSGAKRIKEENKIFFATKEEAEKAGYTPAANCKGI